MNPLARKLEHFTRLTAADKAVLDDLEFPGTDPALRARLDAELAEVGPAAMHARLAARDAWLPGLVAAAEAGGAGRRRAPRGENRPAWLGPPPPERVTQR